MKKIWMILCMIILSAALTACGAKPSGASEGNGEVTEQIPETEQVDVPQEKTEPGETEASRTEEAAVPDGTEQEKNKEEKQEQETEVPVQANQDKAAQQSQQNKPDQEAQQDKAAQANQAAPAQAAPQNKPAQTNQAAPEPAKDVPVQQDAVPAAAPVAQPEKDAPPKNNSPYRDGSYKGSGEAYNGPISLSVTIADGKITEIQITDTTDDEPYLTDSRVILKKVIEKQSVKVDTVAGATVTSEGIIKAIKNALSKAAL